MKKIDTCNQNNYLDILSSINLKNILKHPNILIAANFWDMERYQAAKTCYAYMRAIDDMIDNYKAENPVIEDVKKEELLKNVNSWIFQIKENSKENSIFGNLIEVIRKFRIPNWPFEKFAQSMIYDILNDGFPTFNSFVEYSAGASVAPASVFVHLCGISGDGNEFNIPSFDVMTTATPCAMFSYVVHIIRDFQKDQLDHLNYFANDLMEKYDVSRQELYDIAKERIKVSRGFRELIGEYYVIAEHYKRDTLKMIDQIKPLLEPRYQLSLEIIFNLYLMVFERIDIRQGQFLSEELNPDLNEILNKVSFVIRNFRESATGGSNFIL